MASYQGRRYARLHRALAENVEVIDYCYSEAMGVRDGLNDGSLSARDAAERMSGLMTHIEAQARACPCGGCAPVRWELLPCDLVYT